jgi:MFS transporter, DHA2 family, multidrug resistance protein
VMFTRGPEHAETLTDKLKAGDPQTLDLFGLAPSDVQGGLDSMRLLDLMPDLEKQSLVMAINDAWTLLTVIMLIGLTALLFVRKPDRYSNDITPRH